MKVSYVEEEERGGLDTYVFESSSLPKETMDPEMLAIFPPAVPKDLLVGLAQTLELPAGMREQFATILPTLPDPVPLRRSPTPSPPAADATAAGPTTGPPA